MKINEFFDKVICINLAKRTDRWSEMTDQFNKHNIKATRFNAVNGNPMGWKYNSYAGRESSFEGAMGCLASHLEVYSLAKQNGWKNVLIIEDDCDFIENLNEIFEESIDTLPKDWDLLYFGGVHETRGGKFVPEKFNKFFVRAKRIITTTCYAVNSTAYDFVLDTILKDKPYFDNPIDAYLGAYIQPHLNTYAYHPPIAWQRASHSDIQNAHRDYSIMMKNNNIS
jgi:GR25 family glycosyltransferase involved in LPS biosynthesis